MAASETPTGTEGDHDAPRELEEEAKPEGPRWNARHRLAAGEDAN
jgi:hypothetical protein